MCSDHPCVLAKKRGEIGEADNLHTLRYESVTSLPCSFPVEVGSVVYGPLETCNCPLLSMGYCRPNLDICPVRYFSGFVGAAKDSIYSYQRLNDRPISK